MSTDFKVGDRVVCLSGFESTLHEEMGTIESIATPPSVYHLIRLDVPHADACPACLPDRTMVHMSDFELRKLDLLDERPAP